MVNYCPSVFRGLAAVSLAVAMWPAGATSFMVQCPTSTLLHPNPPTSAQGEPPYTGPAVISTAANGVPLTYASHGGAIKCQQISGGDGFMTEADGNQTYMFAFGPLSGLHKIANGLPGTDFPDEFNAPYCDGPNYNNGQPNPYYGTSACPGTTGAGNMPGTMATSPDGAVGYLPPVSFRSAAATVVLEDNTGVATGIGPITITDPGAGYTAPPTVTFSGGGGSGATATAVITGGAVMEVVVTNPGSGYTTAPTVTFTSTAPTSMIPGTDAAAIMNTGVMNGNIPAPMMVIDEDDEYFLTLTNVGMLMRPDLFEQHTVHFHGYPNASSFYDGVPDASVAINIGASFTYYYLAPDAGTYFFHCHITPPEHLQMGMVGQLYVRPRQNRVLAGTNLYTASQWQQQDLRTACYPGASDMYGGAKGTTPSGDILCSVPPPAKDTGAQQMAGAKYVYDDGDGSTWYDIDVPIQIHGFDPNFHFVGMTFNPEGFSDMKDKYFLLNGRSYPDTVGVPAGSVAGTGAKAWTGGVTAGSANPDPVSNAISTQASDGLQRPSQPVTTLIVLSQTGGQGGTPQRAALRISDLDVSEYQTLASLGIPMQVVGYNAKILRDQAGNNLYYTTNSITLGGGESLDVILDACAVRGPAPKYACITPIPTGTYFLYTPNLDHLSNDAENFGGLMAEVVITP